MVDLRKHDFTLEALRRLLIDAGYTVTDSGDDIAADVGYGCAVLGLPHVPRFFVLVEAADDLLTFTTRVMSTTWAEFERGQMVFRGRVLDDGRAQVAIVREVDDSSVG